MIELKHSFLVITLGALLSSCGGGSNDSTTSPAPVVDRGPTARISAEASMDENTSLTISGEDSSDAEGAISSYSWALENVDGLDIRTSSQTGSTTNLTVDSLPQDVTITVVLTVSDSKAQTSTARANIDVKTLEGMDAGGDGVRDDVNELLETIYPTTDPKHAVILSIAKNKQTALVNSDLTVDETQELVKKSGMASWCLLEAGEDIEDIMAQIEMAQIDNRVRREANKIIDQKFSSSGLIELPNLDEVETYCEVNFDL